MLSLHSSFKLPCGTKNYYPEKLDYLTRKGGICVFHATSDEEYKSYLLTPNKKGVNFVSEGTPFEVVLFYEELELPELEIKEAGGPFYYKFAENEQKFKEALLSVAQKQQSEAEAEAEAESV